MKKYFIIALLLIIAQFLFVGKDLTYGGNMNEIENKKQQLLDQNQEIKLKIAKSSSLSLISQQIEAALPLVDQSTLAFSR